MLDLSNGRRSRSIHTVTWFLNRSRYTLERPAAITNDARWNAMVAQYVSNYAFLVCMDD